MAAFQIIALDTATPQLRAPGTGDTYSAPRAVAIAPESLTGSSATTSLDITQTWNTTGTPTALKLNVTDTASNAASRLLDLQVNGSSILTFRKDSNLGIGTATPVVTANYGGLTVNGTTGGIVSLTAGNVEYLRMFGRSTDSWVFTTAGVPLVLGTNSAERMRISDTGNVGIGTSSPTLLFQVGTRGGMNSSGIFQWGAALTGNNRGILSWDTNVAIIGTPQNLVFCTNSESAERMRLDTTGSLLVGTAINTYGYAGSPSIELNATDAALIALKKGGAAGSYISHNNVLNIFNTTANPIVLATSSTERMRITAAGDVGIGTSLPTPYSGYTSLEIDNATNGGILSIKKAGSVVGYLNGVSGLLLLAQSNDLKLTTTGATSMQFSTNGTERMRITSAGNLQLGTASLATTATSGFPYIPTCAGTPTGTPTAITGYAPMVVDSTNNKLYVYVGGAWQVMN